MSEENVEVVRQPLVVRATTRRALDERLALRFPSLRNRVSGMVLRRRPGSWLRRAMVRRSSRLALEALNRGDYEAAFAVVPPDYETITPPELAGLGFEPVYRGRKDRLRFHRAWVAELGDFQQRGEEVVDLGDHFLLLAHMKGTGASSGAEFETEVAYLFTVSAGQLAREQIYRSHKQALEAAGLSE